MVLLVLKEEFKGKVTVEEIQEFYAGYVEKGVIPKYGIPSKVEFVDQIQKTSVGKINKKEIRSVYND